MIAYKRITILCGHYGSGKTNIAVQIAKDLRSSYNNVAIADIDIVNPYFRTKDNAAELSGLGIRLISSAFAGTNVDVPAIPSEVSAITDSKDVRAVIDVGGDDRGALALGRWADKIKAEKDYEMLSVLNMYRPLTKTPLESVEIMREIERSCKIPFTGIVNNSNLGTATTEDDVLKSVEYADEIARITGLSIKMTTVNEELFEGLSGKIIDLYPLKIRRQIN